jgi:hypothetical protein
MGKRANVLAERIQQGAEALAAFAEGLSDAEWHTPIPGGLRTVGVAVHHVASVYEIEIELATKLASGHPITGVTWDGINQMNGEHAKEHKAVGRQETVELVRRNGKIAADAVRAFTDEALDSGAPVSLYGDAPLTAQFFIEDHALRHSFHHLARLRAALKR